MARSRQQTKSLKMAKRQPADGNPEDSSYRKKADDREF
jgi:hypothetical protein